MPRQRYYMRLGRVFLFFLMLSLVFAIAYFSIKMQKENAEQSFQDNVYLLQSAYEKEIRELNKDFDEALRRIEALDAKLVEIRERNGMEETDEQ